LFKKHNAYNIFEIFFRCLILPQHMLQSIRLLLWVVIKLWHQLIGGQFMLFKASCSNILFYLLFGWVLFSYIWNWSFVLTNIIHLRDKLYGFMRRMKQPNGGFRFDILFISVPSINDKKLDWCLPISILVVFGHFEETMLAHTAIIHTHELWHILIW
jgi:hypothetical protein